MTPSDIFHSHLDVCKHCMEHPFDLCTVGRKLMADISEETQGEQTYTVTQGDSDFTEPTGQFLFGLPIVRAKLIDINRLYARECNQFDCKGHMALVAINTMPVGFCVGITMTDAYQPAGLMQQRRFMAGREARQFFKDVCKRTETIGYHLVWQGATGFDYREGRAL